MALSSNFLANQAVNPHYSISCSIFRDIYIYDLLLTYLLSLIFSYSLYITRISISILNLLRLILLYGGRHQQSWTSSLLRQDIG